MFHSPSPLRIRVYVLTPQAFSQSAPYFSFDFFPMVTEAISW